MPQQWMTLSFVVMESGRKFQWKNLISRQMTQRVLSGLRVDEEWADTVSVPEDDVVAPVRILEVREAFRGLDIVDVETILEQRAAVMKTVPIFLRGHSALL